MFGVTVGWVTRISAPPGTAPVGASYYPPSERETFMGLGDKIGNAGEEAAGKVKEATGKATGNESMEADGKGDQVSANVKQAGEKAKDAVKDAVD
jgi:uncharacterized protein YjbJ (UPF0337 family)